ncbi:MAG: 23S rRNA (adenine(2503)-C(2))-methyltransferase RlmN [Myxococcaceae bacterium]
MTLRRFSALLLPELEAALGSRSRALAAARWLDARDPFEAALPRSIEGVAARAWAAFRAGSSLAAPTMLERSASPDGTTKWVLAFQGEAKAETVLIPARGRSTVCVSSQSGCTRDCTFCATAALKFIRNLSADEIVAQYLVARSAAPADAPARNVVFMGMGEPMDNLDEVLRAVELLIQPPVPRLAAAHITVSTSGVVPGMRRFLKESRAGLALSLNATTDAVREQLMPQNKTWPLAELMTLLREDGQTTPQRIHFMEYVLLEGVNDSDQDAQRLIELLAGVNARVNVIPHNPFSGSPFKPSSREKTVRFQQQVAAGRLRCMIRWPRGNEIAAACGQLALVRSQEAEHLA